MQGARAVSELSIPSAAAPQSGNVLSSPAQFTLFQGLVYFSGNSSSNGTNDLWSTNGTAAGTQDLSPITNQYRTGIAPSSLVVLQNKLLFVGNINGNGGYGTVAEFTSDGTSSGTIQSGLPVAAPAIAFGTNLVFSGFDNQNKDELYSSVNGELTLGQGGTQQNQSSGINPTNFTVLGSAVLFNGNDGASHHEMFATDGSVAGTQELNGIAGESTTGLNPSAGAVIGARMLFAGYDTTTVNGVQYRGLWSTDGTVGGTYEIAVAGADVNGVAPLGLTAISATQAIFNGQDASGFYGLWITDGTSAGTREITGIAGAAAGGMNPGGFAASPIVACYVSGTRIRTRRGDVMVEQLHRGDMAVTAYGETRAEQPVRWIGRTRIDLDRHPRPEGAAPIRVVAGAFGPDRPDRDLLLSPDHAVLLEGDEGKVLVPVRLLANGRSIRREAGGGVVIYHHVELDQHDVLLANNLPAESYLDTGNRADFDNGGTIRTLFPEFPNDAGRELACAPMVMQGAWLERMRAGLAGRAGALGFRLDRDPALRVMADSKATAVSRTGPFAWRAMLPAGVTALRILSRSFVPHEMDRDAADTRRLGVALRSVRIDGAALALAEHAGAAGLHAMEDGWCWTDGAALLHAMEDGWCWTDGAALLHVPAAARARSLEIEAIDLGLSYAVRGGGCGVDSTQARPAGVNDVRRAG